MTEKIQGISHRTDAEWPADHPLRRVSRVMSNEEITARAEFLVCSLRGESRLPPAPDDADVECSCACGAALVKRRSADPKLKPICAPCWAKL